MFGHLPLLLLPVIHVVATVLKVDARTATMEPLQKSKILRLGVKNIIGINHAANL